MAVAVNGDGYCEVLGVAEGMKEDKASWVNVFQWLRERGLDGGKLVVGDKSLGMLEAVGGVFPEAKYQRCTVRFYRTVFSAVPRSKVKLAAKKVEDGGEETLTYRGFPSEHWTRIRTNNVIERLNREIRDRTRVAGAFPDGHSALMLVCAQLRYVAGTQWGNKMYMNMNHLEDAWEKADLAGSLHSIQISANLFAHNS